MTETDKLKVGDYIRIVIKYEELKRPSLEVEGIIKGIYRRFSNITIKLNNIDDKIFIGDKEYPITTIYRREWVKL